MRLEYRGIAPFNEDAAEWNCQIQCLRVWTEDVNKVALHIEPDVHAEIRLRRCEVQERNTECVSFGERTTELGIHSTPLD